MSEWMVKKILPDGRAIEKHVTDPSVAQEWMDRAAQDNRYEVVDITRRIESGGVFTGAPSATPPMGEKEAALRLLQQGAQAGFSDELTALGRKAGDIAAQKTLNLGYKIPPRDYFKEEREKVEQAREVSGPGGTLLLEGAGAVATMPGAKTALGRLAEAGLYGGTYSLGTSEEKKLSDFVKGAFLGGTVGIGAEVLPLLARGGKEIGARSAKKLGLMPEITEEKALLKLRAKKDIGPSREEAAEQYIKTLQDKQKALTSELDETNRLIGEHGEKVKRAAIDNIQTKVQDEILTITKSADKVFTDAHTGLKGDLAKRSFASHLAKKSAPERIATLDNAVTYTNHILDATESVIDTIIQDAQSGIIKRPGSKVTQFKKAIGTYREAVKEVEKDVGKFKALYGKKKQGATPQFMPESLQKLYISLDNMKRQLGEVHSGPLDRGTKKVIEELYENVYRQPLVDSGVWGTEITSAQSELNDLWYRHLKLNPAIERNLMKARGARTQEDASTWGTVAEAEGSKVRRLITDPQHPDNAADMRNFNEWLDTLEQLTGSLTKNYKPGPELQNEVARIAGAKDSIRQQMLFAQRDFARRERVGITPEQRALDEATAYTERGLQPNENIREIGRLRGETERKALERAELGSKERTAQVEELDPSTTPEMMRRRLASDKEYKQRLADKEEAYRDLERTPLGRLAAAGKKKAEAAGGWAFTHHGKLSGLAGGKATDIVSQMWGTRPISTVESEEKEEYDVDPRLEAAKRVESFKKNTTKPKIGRY